MDMISIPFDGYERTVPQALDRGGVAEVLADGRGILIKPNLVTDSPFPVTTSPAMVEAVITHLRTLCSCPLVIAEGCGDAVMETHEVFASLGYTDLARRLDVELLDLNTAPLRQVEDPACSVFPSMWLPDVAFTHTIISLPVLKAHSLAEITGTLKNMMGFPPPGHYGGRYGSWKKAAFHGRMQEAIRDLNRYVSPHFTLMDASIGLADFHLGGRTCDPPPGLLLAGTDSHVIDREAARLLGLDWQRIGHLHPPA